MNFRNAHSLLHYNHLLFQTPIDIPNILHLIIIISRKRSNLQFNSQGSVLHCSKEFSPVRKLHIADVVHEIPATKQTNYECNPFDISVPIYAKPSNLFV